MIDRGGWEPQRVAVRELAAQLVALAERRNEMPVGTARDRKSEDVARLRQRFERALRTGEA